MAWDWQYVFAAALRAIDLCSDGVERRRYVILESVQQAVRKAVRRVGLEVTTARDSSGEKANVTAGFIRIITPQVLNKDGRGVISPFNAL